MCGCKEREQAKRDGGRGAHKQGNGCVSLLNDCVVVGDTVGMVVVAVCCGMDVECNRMWGCTQNTDCTKVV